MYKSQHELLGVGSLRRVGHAEEKNRKQIKGLMHKAIRRMRAEEREAKSKYVACIYCDLM